MGNEHLEQAIEDVSFGEKLILVKLNDEQIEKAKKQNGERRQITHAILCGKSGQKFGTERQCRKSYDVWKNIFPYIFEEAFETEQYVINTYSETFDLVNILMTKNDKNEGRAYKYAYKAMSYTEEAEPTKEKKRGLFNITMGIIVFIFMMAIMNK